MGGAPLPGPSPVAVEDHSDVPRNRGPAALAGQSPLVGAVRGLGQTPGKSISEPHEFAAYARSFSGDGRQAGTTKGPIAGVGPFRSREWETPAVQLPSRWTRRSCSCTSSAAG